MIQGTFLATLARLFCVPPIRRDRGLNSRIVSCLSSASVIAVPYAQFQHKHSNLVPQRQ